MSGRIVSAEFWRCIARLGGALLQPPSHRLSEQGLGLTTGANPMSTKTPSRLNAMPSGNVDLKSGVSRAVAVLISPMHQIPLVRDDLAERIYSIHLVGGTM